MYSALASLNSQASAFRRLVLRLKLGRHSASAITSLDLAELDSVGIDWEPFNKVIAGPRFRGMQEVEIHVEYTVIHTIGKQIERKDVQDKVQEIQTHLTQQLEKVLWYQQGILTMRDPVIEFVSGESDNFDLNRLAPDLLSRITPTFQAL